LRESLDISDKQENSENQVAEEIDGVGGEEQRRVRQYVVSRVGPRD
jgi:26S proteasome non-ATPase regulatory subunit 10